MRTVLGIPSLRAGCLAMALFPAVGWAAESENPESGQITLRKSIGEREYKGRTVEGEERRVAPGDSLWRILIQEKGLSSRRFSEYIVVIRGLNPGLAPNGALRIGETIFIPLRPDEALQIHDVLAKETRPTAAQPGKGVTQEYQIKAGDHLYQVLRQRLGITDERQLGLYYALVKDLNPQKKNWDLLVEGETIRLPVVAGSAEARSLANRAIAEKKSLEGGEPSAPREEAKSKAVTEAPAVATVPPKSPTQTAAREDLALVARVIASLGNDVQTNGEVVLPVKEGAIRFSNGAFPIVYNRNVNQRVIIDPESDIAPSMRAKLSEIQDSTSIFSLSRTMTVHEAVSQLLSRLGYQALSAEQPVILQQGGLSLEATGEWVVLAPEETNKRQQVFVINVADKGDTVPDYLRAQLAQSGVQLKDVSSLSSAPEPTADARDVKQMLAQSKVWPHEKHEIVDSLLFAYGIPFGVSEVLPVELGPGIRLETACDRLFEIRSQRKALFFRRIAPEIKETLESKLSVKVIELEIAELSSRDLIGKLLAELGEPAPYKEHRFSAAAGVKRDKLTVSAWGFLVSKPGMFLTDRQIPKGYERFFFEKGLDIVYFQ